MIKKPIICSLMLGESVFVAQNQIYKSDIILIFTPIKKVIKLNCRLEYLFIEWGVFYVNL